MSDNERLTTADHDARALARELKEMEDECDRLRKAMPDPGMLERAARDLDPPLSFGANDSEPNITSGNLREAAAAIRALDTTPAAASEPATAGRYGDGAEAEGGEG